MSGHVPHEFSSVSVSAYEAATLSGLLQERSAEGWTVVSIVPAGTSVVAYLSRPTSSTTPTATAGAAASTATVNPEPVTPTPASTGAGWALQPESASSTPASSTPASTTTASTSSATSSATASSGAAPAGWYADPSGRFELRYWDGGRWTEHVSRGGNQYTDPPVA